MQQKENPIKVLTRQFIIFITFLIAGIKFSITKPYWHNKEIIRITTFSIIINLTMWTYLFSERVDSNYPIILHYNLFFGVDFVGNYEKVFLLPLIGAMIILLNSLLGQFFYKIEKLASYILAFNTLFVQAILIISGYLIIKANS